MKNKNKKRKYYRHCGMCGERNEQSFMKRVSKEYSDNGWLCSDCYETYCENDEAEYVSEFDNFY